MRKKKRVIVDERDEQNKAVASQWALRMVIGYTVLKMIYYFDFQAMNDLGFLIWDGILLLVIGMTYLIVSRSRKTYDLPKTYREGKAVVGSKKEARKDRIKKSYLPRALSFAAALTLGSGLRSGFISVLVTALLYLTYFIIVFAVVFAWGEWNIKSYNHSLNE